MDKEERIKALECRVNEQQQEIKKIIGQMKVLKTKVVFLEETDRQK